MRRVETMRHQTTDYERVPSPKKNKLGLGRQHRQEKNEGGSASHKELWLGMQRAKGEKKIWGVAGTAQEHTRHGRRTARSKTEDDGENDALLWRTKSAAKCEEHAGKYADESANGTRTRTAVLSKPRTTHMRS